MPQVIGQSEFRQSIPHFLTSVHGISFYFFYFLYSLNLPSCLPHSTYSTLQSVLGVIDTLETASHSFEILLLRKEGEWWHAQFAIDGVKCPDFFEPAFNVEGLREEDFLRYMKAQSLAMSQFSPQGAN